jgi:hypothetical protein
MEGFEKDTVNNRRASVDMAIKTILDPDEKILNQRHLEFLKAKKHGDKFQSAISIYRDHVGGIVDWLYNHPDEKVEFHSPDQEASDKFHKKIKKAWNQAMLNCEQELQLMYPHLAIALENDKELHDEIVRLMGSEVHIGSKPNEEPIALTPRRYCLYMENTGEVRIWDIDKDGNIVREVNPDTTEELRRKFPLIFSGDSPIVTAEQAEELKWIPPWAPNYYQYHILGRILPRNKADRKEWPNKNYRRINHIAMTL